MFWAAGSLTSSRMSAAYTHCCLSACDSLSLLALLWFLTTALEACLEAMAFDSGWTQTLQSCVSLLGLAYPKCRPGLCCDPEQWTSPTVQGTSVSLSSDHLGYVSTFLPKSVNRLLLVPANLLMRDLRTPGFLCAFLPLLHWGLPLL